jgi:hypothetical protein
MLNILLTVTRVFSQALPTTCPEDFDLDDNGSISTGPFDNSDCMPAALAAEAVQDSATSPLPGEVESIQWTEVGRCQPYNSGCLVNHSMQTSVSRC